VVPLAMPLISTVAPEGVLVISKTSARAGNAKYNDKQTEKTTPKRANIREPRREWMSPPSYYHRCI
jgi:hypothetical protein